MELQSTIVDHECPRLRMAQNKALRIAKAANAISANRIFKLRSNIHVNSAADPYLFETNKFWKTEPLVATVRNACREVAGKNTALLTSK